MPKTLARLPLRPRCTDGAVLRLLSDRNVPFQLAICGRTAHERTAPILQDVWRFAATGDGSMFAIVLVALGFVIAVLLIGTPVALIVRGLHGGFSWVAQLRGDASPFGEALVAVSSIAGGVILTAVFVRLLDGLIDWRWKFRARVISARTTRTSIDHHDIAEAV